jgi:hypothetical protein
MPPHAKEDALIAAALERLVLHMHAFNPSAQATGAMSAAKADGTFHTRLEIVFRHVVTNMTGETTFNQLIADGLAEADLQ